MNHELYEEAIHSDVLSEKLISQLLESMEYSSISFINWSIEVLKLIRVRIERGDKIKDEVSGEIYTKKSFHAFVKKHFSSYIESQVFADPAKAEKIYFSLEPCKDGEYNLVMAESSKKKVYEWISSLNERFSLVQMISTGIVYIKDIRSNSLLFLKTENTAIIIKKPDILLKFKTQKSSSRYYLLEDFFLTFHSYFFSSTASRPPVTESIINPVILIPAGIKG